MTVTHVVPYMHPDAGGPPVVVDRLCRRLAARGWDTRVVTTDAFAPPGDRSWADTYAGAYPLEAAPAVGPRGFGYGPAVRAAVRRAVAGSRLVHLHTLWTYPTLAAASACRRLGVPYVVMPHGMLDPHSLARKRLKKWLYAWAFERRTLRRAAALLYTHEEERRLAEGSVPGLPPGDVVPLGADAPPPAPPGELAGEFWKAFPEARGRRAVLFLGRLHPKKGLDLLVPAFARLAAAVPDAHLLLVGPGEPAYVAHVRGLLAGHGLARRATLTGPLRDRMKWGALAAAAVFALPSYQENFALTVVEALQAGLPVVLSERVNIWREVTGAGAGVACALDPDAVAAALAPFLQDDARREAFGARGRELAAGRYTWDRTADATEAVYRRVLGAGPGGGTRP